jgi:hypothetical protein
MTTSAGICGREMFSGGLRKVSMIKVSTFQGFEGFTVQRFSSPQSRLRRVPKWNERRVFHPFLLTRCSQKG